MKFLKKKPVIGITMGDPSGIGPEILLKLLASRTFFSRCRFVIFGDYRYLEAVKNFYRLNVDLTQYSFVETDVKCPSAVSFGNATAWGGGVSGEYILSGVKYAKNGLIDALVTLPINKVAFKLGGWGNLYPGHTEMLASLCGVKTFALMLVHGDLRAVHVTQHISLKQVPHLLSMNRIADTLRLADGGLRDLGFRNPRIAVCGLNPHAGDGGLFGEEEKKLISPAIRKCRKMGIRVEGPFPADAVWPRVLSKVFDVGVAMYHDQGQIAVKLAATICRGSETMVHGVNVTLGLPIIRTSVAHGTAYEIAGQGVASHLSLIDAIEHALSMLNKRDF